MRLLRTFLRDQGGNVAMIFGLSLVPIAGAAGVALDYSRASNERTTLQTAADAAAIAAMRSIAADTASRVDRGTQVFNANRPGPLAVDLKVEATAKQAVVTASAVVPTTLSGVLGLTGMTVGVRSVAQKTFNGPPPCVFALAKSGTGIEISGSASFLGKNCTLQANSSSAGAIDIGGSSSVKADGYCAVGTVTSKSALTPEPEDSCDEMDDPYAGLPWPADTACDPNAKTSVGPNKTATLHPGVYCGGLDLKGDVTLKPGLYVIRNGSLSLNSTGTVTGDGVTFYLMGSGATFDLNGGASLSLSAMQTGPYAGLLIVQDRAAAAGATSKINGNSTTTLKGAIYAPTQNVKMNGNGTFGQASPFMPLIANTVTITGSNTTVVDATTTSLVAPLPQSSSGVRVYQ